MLSALQASAYLHHVHLHTPDLDRLARFYAEVMDMAPSVQADGSRLLAGPGRRVLLSPGPANQLAHAGFAVRDRDGLDGLRERAAKERLNPVTVKSPLFAAGAFAVTDPDDNLIVFGLAAEPADPSARTARLRAPLQHLTLATRNVKTIEAFYAGKLGFGVSDRILDDAGRVTTVFMRGNHEHHNIACFLQDPRRHRPSFLRGRRVGHDPRLVRPLRRARRAGDVGAGPPRTRQQSVRLHRRSRQELDRGLRRDRNRPRPPR